MPASSHTRIDRTKCDQVAMISLDAEIVIAATMTQEKARRLITVNDLTSGS